MKKGTIIRFVILAVIAAAGTAAMGWDLARLSHGGGSAENRQYKLISVEISDVTEAEPASTQEGTAAAEAAAQEAQVYFLCAEKGYVVIFRGDGSFYDYTDIRLSSLPRELQIEVLNAKRLNSQTELYEFLETYST